MQKEWHPRHAAEELDRGGLVRAREVFRAASSECDGMWCERPSVSRRSASSAAAAVQARGRNTLVIPTLDVTDYDDDEDEDDEEEEDEDQCESAWLGLALPFCAPLAPVLLCAASSPRALFD